MRGAWNVCLIGAAAAEPHGKARDVRLARGDVLLMDVGASLHGYQSDITRTFVFDAAPTVEIERVWNAVRDAQRRAFDLTRPSAPCRSVDAGARSLLASLGFGAAYEKFTHRLGHGIGLETHEDPYFDGGSDVLLEAGMTLTDEPGVYLARAVRRPYRRRSARHARRRRTFRSVAEHAALARLSRTSACML